MYLIIVIRRQVFGWADDGSFALPGHMFAKIVNNYTEQFAPIPACEIPLNSIYCNQGQYVIAYMHIDFDLDIRQYKLLWYM